MAGGPLQAALDMDRILAHGITFGLNDKAIDALAGDNRATASYNEARQRAGIAGDIASVLGLGGGAKAALGGVKAIPAIAKAVISKKGLGLGLGGIASLAEYNARTSADAPPKPKAAAAVKQPDAKAIAEHVAGARAAQEEQPAGFDSMVAKLAAGQGGMISLRQMGALSEAAQRAAQANYYGAGGGKRAAAPGDAAGHMLEQQYVSQFQNALQDPKADPAKAQQEFENKVLQLRKTQFIDPYGLQSGAE
jgi:hypothetical protein